MRCTKCGNDHDNKRICNSCLRNWTDMRGLIWITLESLYGKLTPDNHKDWIKRTKKLESIWRKDKQKFEQEIEKLRT